MRERVIAAQCDGLFEMRRHIIRAAEGAIRERDVVVIFSLAIVGGDGFFHQFGRRCGVAGIEHDQAQIVQAVRVAGRLRQEGAITAFCFGERAALVQCHRGIELSRDRARGGREWRFGWSRAALLARGHVAARLTLISRLWVPIRTLWGVAGISPSRLAERKGFEPLIRL